MHQHNMFDIDKKIIKIVGIILGVFLSIFSIANASPVSIDRLTDHIQPLVITDYIRVPSTKYIATSTAPYSQGSMFFDSVSDCPLFYTADPNISWNACEEDWIQVVNNTGSTITNGSAVYISGSTGVLPTVALAKADLASTTVVAGLATEDILNNATGRITALGTVNGLNMSAFNVGNIFLSSSTAGALTQTVPQSPYYRYRVGFVTSTSSSAGKIHVTPSTASIGNGPIGSLLYINASSSQAWIATSSLGIISSSGNSAFTIGNAVIYNATSTDNVGIGTSTPAATLDVWGRSTSCFMPFRVSSSTGQSFFEVECNGNLGIGSTTAGSLLSINASTSNATRNLFTVASSTGSTTFTILPSGFTGVGTSSPLGTFSVLGLGGATHVLYILGGVSGSGIAGQPIFIQSGTGGSSAAGGAVTINGGVANSSGSAGAVNINGGAAAGGGSSGAVNIKGGNNGGTTGGTVNITGGDGGGSGTGGDSTMAGGVGSASSGLKGAKSKIIGGTGATASGNGGTGGDAVCAGGTGGTGSSAGFGGNCYAYGGAAGSGTSSVGTLFLGRTEAGVNQGKVAVGTSSANALVTIGTSTASAQIGLDPTVAPTLTPNTLQVWNDSAQNTLSTAVGGVVQNPSQVVLSQTADKVVTNTTADTVAIGTGVGTTTFPASYFKAGKTIHLHMEGFYTLPIGGGSATLKLQYATSTGTTTLANVTTTSLLTTGTFNWFRIDAYTTFRTVGSAGTAVTTGQAIYKGSAGAAFFDDFTTQTPITVNTTFQSTIVPTLAWDSAVTTKIATTTLSFMEIKN